MKKEYLIKNLITLIYADQTLDPGEKNLMRRICRILDVNTTTLNMWIREVRQKKAAIKVPSGLMERWLFFDVMIAACKADGIIQREERIILERTVGRFGISPETLDQRIQEVDITEIMDRLAREVESPTKQSDEYPHVAETDDEPEYIDDPEEV